MLFGLLVADYCCFAHEGSLLGVRYVWARETDGFGGVTVRPQQAPTARKLSTQRQMGGDDGAMAIGGSGSIVAESLVCM